MPSLTRRQLDRWRWADEVRAIWPRRDDWLRFAAIAIPILTAAVVVAVIVERAP